jgi:phosphoribosylformimino-5-aminoimidazole carboxamide ribotide isomerase
MIAYAAIDIHDGHVVQLVGGDTGEARVVLDDPLSVAQFWADSGFGAIHIVDLDAALGTGDNRALVTAAISAVDIPVQVGGGVRSEADVEHWIEAGASQVVIGTRALQDRTWLRDVASAHVGRIIVAADVRDGFVVTDGWKTRSEMPMNRYITEINDIELGAILVTDVGREGRLAGADVRMFENIVGLSAHPLIASGGVAGTAELRRLADAGVAGVVLGMALYTGAIDMQTIAREYAQ